MKILFSILAIALLAQFAQAHEIDFSMPESTVVVDADLIIDAGKATERVIKAPWATALLIVNNKSHHGITVDSMNVHCTSGFDSYLGNVNFGVQVAAGESASVQDFISALPDNESFKYECIGVLQWTGPHHSHLESFKFTAE